ncbi:alpha/beta hydrolase family esterase [Arenimonas sp. MALMAid1274]|uniref:alpha/beta hydrolase family esterase n=1 Tax=Arenimonas sp. MALMAid1274 TaxID=3411630 RepID=UPI003BA3AF4B
MAANAAWIPMIRAMLAVLLLCPWSVVHAAEQMLEFDIAGQPRRVLVFVPDGPSAGPRTLVVVFHGRGDDDRAFANAVRLHKDWPEAIVAYPRGELREGSSQRGWQYRVGDQGDRDLALTDRLLEEMARRYGTRPESTHVAGFSNGGHFTLLLLAERSEAFATFTVIGSVMPGFRSDSPPRPVLYLFGRGEDRRHKEDWASTVEALARHNLTQGPLTKVMGCCHRQSPAPGGAPFVFGLYGAGHIWPSQGNEWLKAFAGSSADRHQQKAAP